MWAGFNCLLHYVLKLLFNGWNARYTSLLQTLVVRTCSGSIIIWVLGNWLFLHKLYCGWNWAFYQLLILLINTNNKIIYQKISYKLEVKGNARHTSLLQSLVVRTCSGKIFIFYIIYSLSDYLTNHRNISSKLYKTEHLRNFCYSICGISAILFIEFLVFCLWNNI